MAELENVREISLEIVMQVMEHDQYSHIVIRQALDKYDWMDRSRKAFISKLSQGTIETCIRLDAILDAYSKTPVRKMKPLIRNILRIALYQILFMDSVPDRAAVNEAVKQTNAHGFMGLKGFVNGVLRSVLRDKEADCLKYSEKYSEDSIRYCMPDWILDMCTEEYGKDTTKIMMDSLLEGSHGISFAAITGKNVSDEDILAEFANDGAEAKQDPELPHLFRIEQTPDNPAWFQAMREGLVYVQDKSSYLCSLALIGPEYSVGRDIRILDACAAPGGKTMFLGNLLKQNGAGTVVSCDVSGQKCDRIRENLERTGLGDVCGVICQDALVFRPEFENSFDYVLADLPCSGLGILGKKGDIRYKCSPEKELELAELQKKMLANLSRYVKPGGILLFSTCTIHPCENRMNRQWFLEHFDFEPAPLPEALPERYRIRNGEEGYAQLLFGRDDTDGFYFARFRKA